MKIDQPFSYRNGELFCEDVALRTIGKQVGTPCYIYSANSIVGRYREFRSILDGIDSLICYSVKANSNLAVLDLLRREGCGFDVVSGGELGRVRRIGASERNVVFSGVGKTVSELRMALSPPVLSINVESFEELQTLEMVAGDLGVRAEISLRVNPDVSVETHPYIATGLRQHKFGIDMEQMEQIRRALGSMKHIRLVGLGFHIGSQILDVQPFLDAFTKLKTLAEDFRSSGHGLKLLDLGGGLGIPYRGESPPALDRYARFLKAHHGDYRLIFEPGRLFVGDTGVLLNQVLYNKTNHGKRFVIVDGAMNDLMRPALYQAHHEVLPVVEGPPRTTADVVGPVCESGDFFAQDRELPDFQQGDYLAVMNAGAYGFVLSSNYNTRPRAPEVLVDGDSYRIIRRRETLDDLLAAEETVGKPADYGPLRGPEGA